MIAEPRSCIQGGDSSTFSTDELKAGAARRRAVRTWETGGYGVDGRAPWEAPTDPRFLLAGTSWVSRGGVAILR